MTPHRTQSALRLLSAFAVFSLAFAARAQWTPPTDEELKMTSQPEAPGADAVFLFREETTDDKLHVWTKYARIKVLTERGKDLANQELRQYSGSERSGYVVSDIQGRTIHPDGRIIPFTGKPYEKLIEKTQGYTTKAKIFTLPDVEVGSILEFRYALRYDDDRFFAPSWYVQSEYYTRKAHYLWRPTDQALVSKNQSGEQLTNTIAWTPVLPKGSEVTQRHLPGNSTSNGQTVLELNVHDIPPEPQEEFMPPMDALTFRVLFYYSPYRSADEFWKNEGKGWSKTSDKFIGPGPAVRAAVKEIVAVSDTPDQKLRKLYAAVMKVENMSYVRGFAAQQDKAHGIEPPKSADELWQRHAGHSDQISELFVSMARAAGFKAYLMNVTARNRGIFVREYLDFSQLDDSIAIVVVDGKELFFDPDAPGTPYGHLYWPHTDAVGIRQTDSGTTLIQTPGEAYTFSRTQRVANLNMDEHGAVTGTVTMTYLGAPAQDWRQSRLIGDATSLDRDLRVAMEHRMPTGMDVKVISIADLDDFEKPLVVKYSISGQLASSTGKRLLLPGDIFVGNATPTFPHEKRESGVYFHYPHMVQDAVRINFPAALTIESMPTGEKIPLQKEAYYSLSSESTPTSITVRREFDLGSVFFPQPEYPDLRTFYKKLETRDQDATVLKLATPSTPGN